MGSNISIFIVLFRFLVHRSNSRHLVNNNNTRQENDGIDLPQGSHNIFVNKNTQAEVSEVSRGQAGEVVKKFTLWSWLSAWKTKEKGT